MSSLAEVLAWKFDNAPGIRTREDGQGGMEIFDWPTVLGPEPDVAQITAWAVDYDSFIALNTNKDKIKAEMHTRINQGIRWAWSTEEPEHAIALTPSMREVIASWHQLLNQSIPAPNPHGGFIKSNNVIFKGPGDIDIPDDAINEIAEFSGLWVSEISRISIIQETLVEGMDLAELQEYDASVIDWTVTWVDHVDWNNDLCLYNP